MNKIKIFVELYSEEKMCYWDEEIPIDFDFLTDEDKLGMASNILKSCIKESLEAAAIDAQSKVEDAFGKQEEV